MAFGSVHLGESVQTFKSSPKFDTVDMVILNIDENAYVSSPYVVIDNDTWEASNLGKRNGKFTFNYDPESGRWKRSSSAVDLATYGITVAYNVPSVGAKAGDTITVNRMGESKTTDNPSPDIQIVIDLTRSGKTMEANCPLCKPSNRQQIADNLLESLSGYGYQPFYATGAEVNPLAELGDGLTVNGIYVGMYQQDLTFDQMMVSDIGAPYEEEMESEFSYEDSHERTYRRKFADIAADFEIHWNEITARVTREGTGDGFSWSLIETGFSVKAGNKVIFRVDKNGTYTDGTGVFSGQIKGGSISIGRNFSVDEAGNLVCSSAEITGGSISIGTNFSVDENGYMECYGAEFHGDIYAQNGYFYGTVNAGNIDYGGNAGYFDGSGLVASSVGTGRLTSGINTSLGYADYAYDVFQGYEDAWSFSANTIHTTYFYFNGNNINLKTKTFVDGNGTSQTIKYLGV